MAFSEKLIFRTGNKQGIPTSFFAFITGLPCLFYPVPSCSVCLWLISVFEQSPNYLSNVETREHRWVLGEKAERSWLLQGRSGQLTQPQRSNLSPMIYILRLWIIASRDGANKLQSQDELTIHNGVKFFMNGYFF